MVKSSILRRVAYLCLVLVAGFGWHCGKTTINRANRPCGPGGTCIAGYTCDPATNICVHLEFEGDNDGTIDQGICSPDTWFCDTNGRTLHHCNVDGTALVPADEQTCSFACVVDHCAAATNIDDSTLNACTSSAPRLTPPSGTVRLTSAGITCSAGCGTEPFITPVASNADTVIYCVSSLNLPSEVSFTENGTERRALILLVDGNATIDGAVNLNGNDPVNATGFDRLGGIGGPGGQNGANGCGANQCDGFQGEGAGGGGGGQHSPDGSESGGGGGAGFAGLGGAGGTGGTSPDFGVGGTSGSVHGNPVLSPLFGGSGGGSGSDGDGSGDNGSGPGGGGGGAIQITARGILTMSGSITANGGAGGSYGSTTNNSDCGAGGGGSGGAVLLESPVLIVGAVAIEVKGGNGGQSFGNNGGVGAFGTSIDGAPGVDSGSRGGSGGGGGGGWIRFHAASLTGDCSAASPQASCIIDTTM